MNFWHLYCQVKYYFLICKRYWFSLCIMFRLIYERWRKTMFVSLYNFFYLEFKSVVIGTKAQESHRCSSRKERYPAGYSRLSLSCIEGCARNYRCRYGKYNFWSNNCHKFANRLSAVLCTTGTTCPSWCLGSCNYARSG